MHNFNRALVVGVAIVICGLAVGCKKKIDSNKAEKLIKGELADKLEVTFKSVDCPKDVKVKKGVTFTCTATFEDGTELTINAEQTDDEGYTEFEPEPFIVAATTAKVMEEEAKKNGVDVKFDCGKPIQPITLPGTIECTGTADGKSTIFEVTFDKDGAATWKPKP